MEEWSQVRSGGQEGLIGETAFELKPEKIEGISHKKMRKKCILS